MDPCEVFPVELQERLWRLLDEGDLLSCRAVSSSWRGSADESLAWKRHLPPSSTASEAVASVPPERPWETYLRLKKRSAAWTSGMFDLHRRPHLTHGSNQNKWILLGNKYVYICEEKRVLFFDVKLSQVRHEHATAGRILKADSSGDILAVVSEDIENRRYYVLEILEGDVVKRRVSLASRMTACINRGGWKVEVAYEDRTGELRCWSAADGKERRLGRPEGRDELTQIRANQGYWAVLGVHRVSRGAGFTVYRSFSEGSWEPAYTAENRCPLAVLSGAIDIATGALLVLEFHTAEAFGFDRSIVLTGEEKPLIHSICRSRAWIAGNYLAVITNSWEERSSLMELRKIGGDCVSEFYIESRPIAFHARTPEETVMICKNGAFYYFKSGRILYRLTVGNGLIGAKFAQDSILLWNDKYLYVMTLKDVDASFICRNSVQPIHGGENYLMVPF